MAHALLNACPATPVINVLGSEMAMECGKVPGKTGILAWAWIQLFDLIHSLASALSRFCLLESGT